MFLSLALCSVFTSNAVKLFDLNSVPSPIILKGNDSTAYRDPAVLYHDGTFYLFCTVIKTLIPQHN